MKKILISAFAAVASAAVFAGMNNVVISFSTPGPDRYSDGTDVEDGECYALVWTPTGSEFAGIDANGKASGGSRVVLAAPVAKDKKCPSIMFEVDEDYVAANYPGGTWSVVLLDTRVFKLDADGKPVVTDGKREILSKGDASKVNGYGVVGSAKAADAVKGAAAEAMGGVAASSGDVASDTPAPVVKDISFDDNYVYITITSTKPAYKYTLESGDTPGSISEKEDAPADYGSETTDVILVKPKKAGGEFFKVNCK